MTFVSEVDGEERGLGLGEELSFANVGICLIILSHRLGTFKLVFHPATEGDLAYPVLFLKFRRLLCNAILFGYT